MITCNLWRFESICGPVAIEVRYELDVLLRLVEEKLEVARHLYSSKSIFIKEVNAVAPSDLTFAACEK